MCGVSWNINETSLWSMRLNTSLILSTQTTGISTQGANLCQQRYSFLLPSLISPFPSLSLPFPVAWGDRVTRHRRDQQRSDFLSREKTLLLSSSSSDSLFFPAILFILDPPLLPTSILFEPLTFVDFCWLPLTNAGCYKFSIFFFIQWTPFDLLCPGDCCWLWLTLTSV